MTQQTEQSEIPKPLLQPTESPEMRSPVVLQKQKSRLSTIQQKLKNVNPNQMELQKKNIKFSFMNPSSIIDWFMMKMSQHYIFCDINKRIIDGKQQDYLDNQIIFWNVSILFCLVFTAPFFMNIKQLLNSEIDLTEPSNMFVHVLENKEYYSSSAIFGFLFFITLNIIIAIYRYKANYDQRVFHYRLTNVGEAFETVFAKYNWKIDNKNLYKFFLTQRLTQAKSALNKMDEQRTNISDILNEKNRCIQLKTIGNIVITIILAISLILIILADYAIFQYTPLDILPSKGTVSVTKGLLIVFLSDIFSRIMKLLLKYIKKSTDIINRGKNNQMMEAMTLYLLTNINIFLYIIMHSMILSGSKQYNFIEVKKDTDEYDCKYEQIGYQIGGLYLGSIIYGLLKTIIHFIFQKINVSYQAESMMKLQQQLILCCLAFTTFFSFFLAFILQIIMFYLEKVVLIRRMISANESSKQNRHAFVISQGINSLCIFIYFGIMMTLKSDEIDLFTSAPLKVCGPYGTSMGNFFLSYFYSNYFSEFIVELVTWMPLLYIVIILLLCFFLINRNNTQKWKEKIEAKQNELNDLKKSYKSQVTYLTSVIQGFEYDLMQYRMQGNQDDFNFKQNNDSFGQQDNSIKTSYNDLQPDYASSINHANGQQDSIVSNSYQMLRKNTSQYNGGSSHTINSPYKSNQLMKTESYIPSPQQNGIRMVTDNFQSSLLQNMPRTRADTNYQSSPIMTSNEPRTRADTQNLNGAKNTNLSSFFKENVQTLKTEGENSDSKTQLKKPNLISLTTKKTFFD